MPSAPPPPPSPRVPTRRGPHGRRGRHGRPVLQWRPVAGTCAALVLVATEGRAWPACTVPSAPVVSASQVSTHNIRAKKKK